MSKFEVKLCEKTRNTIYGFEDTEFNKKMLFSDLFLSKKIYKKNSSAFHLRKLCQEKFSSSLEGNTFLGDSPERPRVPLIKATTLKAYQKNNAIT